jgi:Uma2 family endonuclease
VEVLSPSDRPLRLSEKLRDHFDSGTRLAWVINPAERKALVYRGPAADRLLRLTDALDREDVLPGFRLRLAELFAELLLE